MKLVNKTFLYFYIFSVGIATMGLEMSASRLFAPYLGGSMVVWAALIGVILLGLAGGYVWGGRLADRFPRPRVIFWITIAVGLWIAPIPLIAPHLIRFAGGLPLSGIVWLVAVSVLCSIVMLGPPITGLGMVTPFVLRLILDKLDRAGEAAGRMFAISTTGNILGVFLPTLVTIPYLGTWQTIEGIAGLLILISVIGLGGKSSPALLLAIPFFAINPHFQKVTPNRHMIVGQDSYYQYVRVEKDNNGPSRYLVTNEGGGTQSEAGFTGLYSNNYWDYYAPLLTLGSNSRQRRALVLGSAGGTIAHQMRKLVPGRLFIEGVEIDPLMIEYGYRYFDNKDFDRVVNADGRRFLQDSQSKYDLIVVDVYNQQIYIPFHMVTREFFRLAHDHLAKDGIVAMNVCGFSADSRLMLSVTSTLKAVFPHVYSIPMPNTFGSVVIATDKARDWKSWQAASPDIEPLVEITKDLVKEVPNDPGGLVFTDNRAPVEFVTDREFWQFMREMAKHTGTQWH